MQKNNFTILVLAFTSFALSIYTVYNSVVLNEKIEKLQKQCETDRKISQPIITENDDEEFPLGEYMGKLQYYAHKAGMAGKYQNWELAEFYVHELEETVEFLTKQNIIDEGKEVSKLLSNIMPVVNLLDKNTKEKDAVEFPKTYQNLLRNCNNCHISVDKPYIVVQEPQRDFDGQKFKK